MRNAITVVFALMLVGIEIVPVNAQQATTLNSTYEVTVGDVVAFIMPEFLKLNGSLTAPTLVTYEPDPGVLDIEIFGQRAQAEVARSTMDQLQAFIAATLNPYLDRRFGITLETGDYRIMYYQWTTPEGPTLVLIFENGQYVMP